MCLGHLRSLYGSYFLLCLSFVHYLLSKVVLSTARVQIHGTSNVLQTPYLKEFYMYGKQLRIIHFRFCTGGITTKGYGKDEAYVLRVEESKDNIAKSFPILATF